MTATTKSIPRRRLKQQINEILRRFGYEIVTLDFRTRMPIELSEAECEIIRDVVSNKLTMNSFSRLVNTVLACKYVIENEIEGDYVESGVWRGGNALVAASIFALYGSSKKVWLFDTFTGSTEPSEKDLDFRGEAATPLFNQTRRDGYNDWCYSSYEEVQENFASRKLLNSNVVFIRGPVSQSLRSEVLPAKISVLLLDTDWYESRKLELEILYPRLSIGGCISLDYGAWRGNKSAADEYFQERSIRPLFLYSDPAGRVAVKLAP